MSREIEFRAWDDLNETMHYQSGMLHGIDLSNQMAILIDLKGQSFNIGAILMQYIDRKDKNMTKIFDGDLLKNPSGRICKVVWHSPSSSWDYTPINAIGDSSFFESNKIHNCEIIGNIHQNN